MTSTGYEFITNRNVFNFISFFIKLDILSESVKLHIGDLRGALKST